MPFTGQVIEGDEDGVRYRTEFKGDRITITVSIGERAITQDHVLSYEPRFGYDVDDIAEAEALTDKLIAEIKEQ